VFKATGLTVVQFAERLGVTRVTLSRLINGKSGVSAEMAVRLAAALGGSVESLCICRRPTICGTPARH
jgi:addiction module HigA family antidote